MTQRETTETGAEAAVETERREPRAGREYVSRAGRYVRGVIESGVPAGVVGGVSLFRGVRAFRRGDLERSFGHVSLGGVLVAIGLAQRQSSRSHSGDRTAVDQTDVVSTGPDLGDIEERDGRSQGASGEEAGRVAGSSIDIEDAGSSPGLDSDVDATATDRSDVAASGIDEERLADASSEPAEAETEPYERLGAAAFDEHSSEVPVPQRAFNRNILSLNSEAFWGIRDGDDAVFASQEFDLMRDGDEIRYVASSEIDGDRTLTIPDAVLDHWDIVAGGGMAVAGGDDIAFVTSDSLQADGQVRLVPERWIEDVLGDGE
ncbi:hypothetical protein [Natrinema salsiterrestre]|uniref:Uncharacterized protein n=1 Tax=Natrinema salsiterrestre TaxID=2950540 RepID=A0A9Q4PZ43_9EURY|nr:hypothetical protein [Natrinema salsiterrestre]MDF9744120.1 hypothetical protein [Natrinema salsiterrestre]